MSDASDGGDDGGWEFPPHFATVLGSWRRVFRGPSPDRRSDLLRAAIEFRQMLLVAKTEDALIYDDLSNYIWSVLSEIGQEAGIGSDDVQHILAQSEYAEPPKAQNTKKKKPNGHAHPDDEHQQPDAPIEGVEQVDGEPAPARATRRGRQPQGPLIQTAAEFIRDFKPPDYLIVGLLQRRFFYSFTGRTGSGKTAILLYVAMSIAIGQNIGPFRVKKGRVLYLCGENPDDVRMRLKAMAAIQGFDLNTIDVFFVPGRFKISELSKRVSQDVIRIGGEFALVIVDTSAAYFEGKDENSNVDAINHAMALRDLHEVVPGGPTILAATHPPKNAPKENLMPRGGGAFLNETDGNLTADKTESAIEVHWQGKYRGPEFSPIHFRVETVHAETLLDSEGNQLPTVIAKHMSDQSRDDMADVATKRMNKVLLSIDHDSEMSRAARAKWCELCKPDGTEDRKQVENILVRLQKSGLIKIILGKPQLTTEGQKQVKKLKPKKTAKEGTNEEEEG